MCASVRAHRGAAPSPLHPAACPPTPGPGHEPPEGRPPQRSGRFPSDAAFPNASRPMGGETHCHTARARRQTPAGAKPDSTPHGRGVDKNGRTDRSTNVPVATALPFRFRSLLSRPFRVQELPINLPTCILTLDSHIFQPSRFCRESYNLLSFLAFLGAVWKCDYLPSFRVFFSLPLVGVFKHTETKFLINV